MSAARFLGIDLGTQGLSVLLTDAELNVLGCGQGNYPMVADLPAGCYEQHPSDWESALVAAMDDLRAQLGSAGQPLQVAAIGIAGQMHGEVLCNATGDSLAAARLWCDARNGGEADELTEQLGVKVPKRTTAARWLWTTRARPQLAAQVGHLTTPAGWLAFRLTGQWNLGIGDASGMFPIDVAAAQYDADRLNAFDQLVADGLPRLDQLLPRPLLAGSPAGRLHTDGSRLLGLEPGIPVAAAEGDQPAGLAGSLISSPGTLAVVLGTSVCANAVGDRRFDGVSRSVDHFSAVDGQPINMVLLRNGTTFLNKMVQVLGQGRGLPREQAFETLMPQLLSAPIDCGGLIALPFLEDEPGLAIESGQNAAILGIGEHNATPGNILKAALLATLFNLRYGLSPLDDQDFPRTEIVLSGGLTKSAAIAQIVADVFQTPVRLLDSSDERTAWGAALLAKYRIATVGESSVDWIHFLHAHDTEAPQRFQPDQRVCRKYDTQFACYRRTLDAHHPHATRGR